jgi:hypothetical protein
MVQYCGYQRPDFLDGEAGRYVRYRGLAAEEARFTSLRQNGAPSVLNPPQAGLQRRLTKAACVVCRRKNLLLMTQDVAQVVGLCVTTELKQD